MSRDRHGTRRSTLPAAARRHQQHILDPDLLPLIRRAWTIVGVAVALALLLLVGIGWMEGVYSTAPTISQTRR